MLRLFRVAKLRSLLDGLSYHLPRGSVLAFLCIVKLVFPLVTICHVVACLWYGVGSNSHPEDNWIAKMPRRDPTMTHLYLAAFHWAFAQFTPSNTIYHPQNVTEEAVNIAVLICGFVVFSSFVGLVT